MKEFLLGVVIAALAMLGFYYNDLHHRVDAIQLQVNLLTSQIDREAGCKTYIPVLTPGDDFYHPNVTSLCGQR